MPILNRSNTLTATSHSGVPCFGIAIVACQNARMKTAEPIIMYTRAGCHLCQQVAALLDRACIPWRPVDIDDDAGLSDRYGLRIPVLRRSDTGSELNYPFDEAAVLQFTRAET